MVQVESTEIFSVLGTLGEAGGKEGGVSAVYYKTVVSGCSSCWPYAGVFMVGEDKFVLNSIVVEIFSLTSQFCTQFHLQKYLLCNSKFIFNKTLYFVFANIVMLHVAILQ